jgi:uncharacterized membrane protein YhaH (DUF805 family)
MKKPNNLLTWLCIVIGLAFQFAWQMINHSESTGVDMAAWGLLLAIMGAGILTLGCMNYAEVQGHSKWLGLLGLFSCIGLLILFLIPSKQEKTPPDTDVSQSTLSPPLPDDQPAPSKAKHGSTSLNPFSFIGRATRAAFWFTNLGVAIAGAIFHSLFIGSGGSPDGEVLFLYALVLLAATFVLLALHARRWHDLGYSGWFAVLLIVPFVNLLYFVVTIFWLGFVRGKPETNRFGDDPLQPLPTAVGPRMDYVECPSCGTMISPEDTECPKCGWHA